MPATDTSGNPFKNDTAVYADARSAYAILRALIPSRDKVSGEWTLSTGMRNGTPEILASENILETFGKEKGTVYVMSKNGFEESKDLVQWKSKEPEKPLFKVEVDIEDYKSVGGKIEVAVGVETLVSKFNGIKNVEVDGFTFVEVSNPRGFLEEITKGGDYIFSGSTRRMVGELDPSNSVSTLPAIYMTRNPVLSMFHGLVGGTDNKISRENTITMQIDDETGEITYPVAEFSVGNSEAIAEEGYVYIIKNSLRFTRNNNGEYLSSDSVKPDLVLKFKKGDFPFDIRTPQVESAVV